MGKDSFLLYTEWGRQVERLSDDQAGVLLKAIFAYNRGDAMPDMDDKTDMCFAFIQGQLDRDSKKYDDVCEKRRESGKKGGVANASKRKQTVANASKGKQTVANQADNDNEYDNDNDNEYDDDDDELIMTTAGTMIRKGDIHFGKTVRLGIKRTASSSSQDTLPEQLDNRHPITQEEKDRIMKRLEDFKRRQGG